MRVLIVFERHLPQIRGGIDIMVDTLARELSRNHEVTLFAAWSWERHHLTREVQGGVVTWSKRLRPLWDPDQPVRAVPGWLWEFPRTLLEMYRLLKGQGIDLIHLHSLRADHYYFSLLGRLLGIPVLLTFHGSEKLRHGRLTFGERRLLRWILDGCCRVNAVSAWLAGEMATLFPHLAPIPHIHNGVDPGDFRQRAPVPGVPATYFLLIGPYRHLKGHDTALAAWALLGERFSHLHLVTVGDQGELSAIIPEQVERSPARERIHLLGYRSREEVLSLLQGAVGLIAPSRLEGFGLAPIEAGFYGKPVVASDIGAFRETIGHGETGLLFPVGDPQALAQAVARIMDEAGLGRRLGEALKKRVEARYSAAQMAEGYERLYRQAMEAGLGGGG